jgi:4-amino-4-deoxy-L-arabinose transferase-like glycosyltransferase
MCDTAPPTHRPLLTATLFVGLVTAWRLAVLAFDAPFLSFDEAQYWAWAQTLQLGYYSKPPMVAWAIAATTAVCGDGPGCVKAGSTFAHGGTAMVLYFLGAHLFGPRVGAWSAVGWTVIPAVSLSAMMITTDPFLLLFWALALLFLAKAADAGPRVNRWWLLLGLAFGLGLLAKYAMALFAASAALWLAWSPERRRLAKAPGLWLAAGVGMVVYAPNALWNAANGFVSYAHTKDNANLKGELFHFDKLAEFVGGQFGVFGPIAMAALLVALAGAFRRPGDDRVRRPGDDRVRRPGDDRVRRPGDDRVRLLAAFTLPVLALMTVESFLSRANANWTAPAFVAGTVLVAALLASRAPRLLAASLALHVLITGVMYNLDAVRAAFGVADTARYDPMKRLRGWEEVGRRVSAIMADHPGARLMADERKVLATLVYAVRPHPFDAVKRNPEGDIHDHFDQTTRLNPREPLLIYVTEHPDLPAAVASSFERAAKVEDIALPIHRDYVRRVGVWRLDGFKGYAP